MVEPVGKKLQQARVHRGLSVDEAAHATKLRPDKIIALENDDYSRFANNTYAKGFLQIYGRFLGVDVTELTRTLDNSNPISVGDYQYLSNAPLAPRETVPARFEKRGTPSFAPFFVFLALIVLGLGGSWIWTTYQRIQNEQQGRSSAALSPSASVNPDAEFIAEVPVRAAATPRPVLDTPAPAPRVVPPVLPTPRVAPPTARNAPLATPAAATPPPASPPPIATHTPPPKPAERDFVTPPPVTSTEPTVRPGGVNEVLVAAIKKTWVIVRKDDPKAAPIFEDYVYPSANPLKLKGARFFIEARDPASVQITKNGLPFTYQSPAVPVE
jgi:cytoskeletal protein RodZ